MCYVTFINNEDDLLIVKFVVCIMTVNSKATPKDLKKKISTTLEAETHNESRVRGK